MWGKSQTKRFTEASGSSSGTLGPGCYETERGENLLRSQAYSKLIKTSSDRFSKENRKILSNLGPGSYELNAAPLSVLKENKRNKTRRVSASCLTTTSKNAEINRLIVSAENGSDEIMNNFVQEKEQNSTYEFSAAETKNERLRKRLRNSYTENSKLELNVKQLRKDLHDLRVNSTYSKQLKTLQLLTKDVELATIQRDLKNLKDKKKESTPLLPADDVGNELEEFQKESHEANLEVLRVRINALEEIIKATDMERDAFGLLQNMREEKLRSQLIEKDDEIQNLDFLLEVLTAEKEESNLTDVRNEGIINKLEMEGENKDAKFMTLRVKHSSLQIDFESHESKLTINEKKRQELEERVHEKETLAEQLCIEQEVLKADFEALGQRFNLEKLEHESMLTAMQFANDERLEEITEDLAKCISDNYTLIQRLRRQEVAFNIYRLALVSSMTKKWSTKLTEKQHEIEGLNDLISERDKRIEYLVCSENALQKQLDDLMMKNKRLEQKLDENTKSFEKLQESSSSEIAKTKHFFENHIRKSHEKSELLKAFHKNEEEGLKRNLADTEESVKRLTCEVSKYKNDLEKADEKYTELKKCSESKIDESRKCINFHLEQLDETQEKLKMVRMKSKKEMKKTFIENEKLKSLLEDAKAECLVLQERHDLELSQVNADIDKLKKQHKQDVEDYKVALDHASFQTQQRMQKLDKLQQSSNDEINSYKLLLDKAEKAYTTQQERYQSAIKKVECKEDRIKECENKLALLAQDNAHLERTSVEAHDTIKEYEAELSAHVVKLEAVQKENMILKNQIAKATNAIVLVEEATNASLETLSAENEGLRQEVQVKTAAIEKLSAAFKTNEEKIRPIIENFQQQIKNKDTVIETLKEQKEKHDFELEKERMKRSNMEDLVKVKYMTACSISIML